MYACFAGCKPRWFECQHAFVMHGSLSRTLNQPTSQPLLTSCPAAAEQSAASSLSTSPTRQQLSSGVHFDLSAAPSGALSAEGSQGSRPMFKRSLSMAELAAAELVRQEERVLPSQDSGDARMMQQLSALAVGGGQQQQQQDAAAGLQPHSL